MRGIIPVRKNIYWIGANDNETDLFEAVWPLPKGVSYNSYIIVDDKVALIDAVKSSFLSIYLDKIKSLLGNEKKVDYLVVNHMEPDHSGAVKDLKRMYPDMKIIGNQKTAEFIKNFYEIEEGVQIIGDGEEIELGEHTLQFFLAPMVHWPETMVTYEKSQKVAFTCDAFGGFGNLDDRIFDDQVDIEYYENEILRYFSNIVGRYSGMVQRAIKKLKDVEIDVVAPSHGPIWREKPQEIIDLYDKWSNHDTEEGITLVYASMYGNTRRMTEVIARSLADEGVEKVRVHDISREHISYVLVDIWRYRGMILGAPTYNTQLFPRMNALVSTLKNKMLKKRYIGIFGNYSWSKGAVKALDEFVEESQLTRVKPVIEAQSSPTENDFDRCVELGKNMAEAIKKQPE